MTTVPTNPFGNSSAWLLSLLLCVSTVNALADGPLDPRFGYGDGLYAYPIGSSGATASAVAQDSMGRIVTAGNADVGSSTTAFVTRHSLYPPGVLDESFGFRGIVENVFDAEFSDATGIAIDHQGRLVVGGYFRDKTTCGSDSNWPTYHYAVTRLTTDGSPDPSFASSGPTPGTASVIVGDCHDTGTTNGVTIDVQDNITAVGSISSDTTETIALARWTADGNLDARFGVNGIVTTTTPFIGATGKAIVSDPTGKLWLVAQGSTPVGHLGIILRYNANGSLDTEFGGSGMTTFSIGYNGRVCCIALDHQGRAVIAGDADEAGGSNKIFVARFTNAGHFDTTFGASGIAKPVISDWYSYSYGLTLDESGRPYVTGNSSDFELESATLVQYNLDGSLNTATGFGGIFTTMVGFSDSSGMALLLDAQNRPVLSAVGYDRAGAVPVLIRYDEMFGDGFD